MDKLTKKEIQFEQNLDRFMGKKPRSAAQIQKQVRSVRAQQREGEAMRQRLIKRFS